MRHHPLPVLVVTRASNADSIRLEKLQLLGAVQTLYKPTNCDEEANFVGLFTSIVSTVIDVRKKAIKSREDTSDEHSDDQNHESEGALNESSSSETPVIIALGASTGGPIAISEIIRHFSANSPPILIAQHISDRFLKTLVQGWQRLTDMRVRIAEHGMQISRGGIYVAPPEHHMEIDSAKRIKLLSTVATDKFAPSVNILFNSLARDSRSTVIAALLTGMGDDGADGLLRLRKSGAKTISEHQSSCVVYGMPARAEEIGASAEVLRLTEIGPRISEHIEQWNSGRLRKSMETCETFT